MAGDTRDIDKKGNLISYTWFWGAILIAVMLLLAGAFYWSYKEHQRQYTLNFQVRSAQYAGLVAEATTARIESVFDNLEFLASLDSVVQMDESGVELLEKYFAHNRESTRAITRISEKLRIIHTTPDHKAIGADLSEQAHNRWMVEHRRRLVSDPFRAVQGFTAVSIAVPVQQAGDFRGGLGQLVDFADLIQPEATSTIDNNAMRFWLVNGSGVVLKSPYAGQTGKSVYELFPGRRESLGLLEPGASAAGTVTVRGGFEPGQSYDNQTIIGGFSRLDLTPDNSWFVFTLSPEAEVLDAFPAARLPFIVAALFLAALVAGSVVVIRTLTRYKLALEHDVAARTAELEISRSKYMHLINEMHEGVSLTDTQGTITLVNPAMERILGVTEGGLTGCMIAEFVDTGQMPVLLYHNRLRQQNQASSYELKIRRADDVQRTLWISGTPVTGRDGSYEGAISFVQDVTIQKLAEEALRQERRMFIEGPVVVFKLRAGATFPVEYVSPNVTQFGYSPEEMLTGEFGFVDIVHEEDRARLVREIPELVAAGSQSFKLEFRLLRSDNQEVWVSVYTSVLKDDEGQPTSYIGYLLDISDRRRTDLTREVLLSISEAHSRASGLEDLVATICQQLGLLIDTTNFYVALYDSQTGLYNFPFYTDEKDTDFSQQNLEHSLTDYVRRTGKPLFSNEETHRQLQHSGEIQTIGPMSPVWLGVPLRTSSGVIGVVAVQSYRSGDTYGRADLDLLAYVSDHIAIAIERKQAETALLKSEETYRRLVEVVHEGIVTVDENEVITFANDNYCQTTGYPRNELIGRPMLEMVDAASAGKIRRATELKRQGQPTSYEISHRTRTGEMRDFLVSSAPLINSQGQYEGAIGVLVDVTDRNRSQEILLHTQKLESLGVLAGGIAHDFNNLLVGIIGNAELARGDALSGGEISQYLADIERGAQRAAELTRQMLAYSGKGKFNLEPVDLGELTIEIGRLLEAAVPKSVKVAYSIDPEVPKIAADPAQIRQIVMNLILNGAEAIGQRPGLVSVKVGVMKADSQYLQSKFTPEVQAEGTYAFLEVTDNGCGMDEQTVERIFDPFFTTKFTGRGLGLAAVLGIVRSHGGVLKLDSETGRGSTFRILFPAQDEAEAESRQTDEELAGLGLGGRILLVDDEPAILKVGERILTRAGFEVDCASDGVEGVKLFSERAGDYALVVLDITMPRMGGDEACREMLNINPAARILLMSGYDEQDVISQFAGRKLAGFIQKPFSSDYLLRRVRLTLSDQARIAGAD